MTDWQAFDDFDRLSKTLALTIAEQLQQVIDQTGQAVLAVSGGNTPKLVFEYLSLQNISWSKVVILLVDERWVTTDQTTSNEHLVRQSLLKNNAAAAQFIGLKTDDVTALQGEPLCNNQLAHINKMDVLILGMGDDGHTASIFPCLAKPVLTDLLKIPNSKKAMAATPSSAPFERMSLTADFLLTSQHRYLLIKGEDKKRVYEQALLSHDIASMPIRLFIHAADQPLHIYYAEQ